MTHVLKRPKSGTCFEETKEYRTHRTHRVVHVLKRPKSDTYFQVKRPNLGVGCPCLLYVSEAPRTLPRKLPSDGGARNILQPTLN